MNKFTITVSLALLFNVTLPAFSADLSIVGSIPSQVITRNLTSMGYSGSLEKKNIILLEKVELSINAKKELISRIEKRQDIVYESLASQSYENSSTLPGSVNLGMNYVPVLNQGIHGSCATFAVAGLLDSLIGKKDYVSQLCSLSLGNFLANKTRYPSGWNGSNGPTILNQFFTYGIISISKQTAIGCGGLTHYPVWDPLNEGGMLSKEDYMAMSTSIKNQYEWHSILTSNTAFVKGRYNSDTMLRNVKQNLANGNRMTLGVLLDVGQGSNGAVAKYKGYFFNDTWMLNPAIINDIKNQNIHAGHAMIIIGYDDYAAVKDAKGYTNKGLLTLRNSWGSSAGDNGNYYMSYDYFKAMTHSIQIVTLKKTP